MCVCLGVGGGVGTQGDEAKVCIKKQRNCDKIIFRLHYIGIYKNAKYTHRLIYHNEN